MEHGAGAIGPDGDWLVEAIGAEPVGQDAPRQVRFDSGIVSGRVGVNRFNGPYRFDGRTLQIEHLAMTKMAGPPEMMELEERFTSALSGGTTVSREGDRMVIGEGDHTIRLTRASTSEIRGIVTYREQMMLPPGSVITVELVDSSTPHLEPVASQTIAGAHAPPFPFSLTPAVETEPGKLALQARVVSEEGEMLWSTDSPVAVIPGSDPVELLLGRPA